jgi:predicted ATPase
MYVIQALIENVRTIEKARWKISPEEAPGWHVILGENGSGKTSFLRSIALALVGPSEAPALRLDWDRKRDKFSKKGMPPKRYFLPAAVRLSRSSDGVTLTEGASKDLHPRRHVWGGRRGWFCASYGPFRRFLGGNAEVEKLYHSHARLARHLSVFGENVALSEPIAWLKQLDYESRNEPAKKMLLADVRAFVNQDGFLPHNAKLSEVSPEGVIFHDGNGNAIAVEELSDGYRSLLSMTFELIRQLVACYGPTHVFSRKQKFIRVTAPGVILIDEVDAHLHPSWQLSIGSWMREHFPKIQFIVSTHSPLICQAADVGTVWRLPRPGTDEKGKMLTGEQLDRVLYGNPVEAYGSEGFNLRRLRSDKAEAMLARLATLNRLELKKNLTKPQRAEQARLRRMFPTSAFEVR